MSLKTFAKAFAVKSDKKLDLSEIDPRDKSYFESREEAEASLVEDTQAINLLQDRLFAEAKQALLLVLQATDAAGKDGTIRKVFGPVDPLGLRAYSFKKPTPAELAHDFLWRVHQKAPAKGEIAIFNRSHYEDVLVVRVRRLQSEEVVAARYDQINDFERLLSFYGTRIIKVYLHVSKEEQRERLQERVDIPEKRWKFNPGDLEERKLWDDYQQAFETALTKCSTAFAPWYVIPADRNWYRNALVARLVRLTLEDMNPEYPDPDFDPSGIEVV
ncbi:MAG: polyphosphate kinase 2 family protein [Kiloniellales bacterium]|nr:polyphosphate kinase 2 family protein [Kiloniellales bacterium]